VPEKSSNSLGVRIQSFRLTLWNHQSLITIQYQSLRYYVVYSRMDPNRAKLLAAWQVPGECATASTSENFQAHSVVEAEVVYQAPSYGRPPSPPPRGHSNPHLMPLGVVPRASTHLHPPQLQQLNLPVMWFSPSTPLIRSKPSSNPI
jgi:hypothetical protein